MWLARRASSWLLSKVKERRTVKVQAHEETCKASGSWNRRDRDEVCCDMKANLRLTKRQTVYGGSLGNDMLILDCAMYFKRLRPTVLCSGDRNLCIVSQAQGKEGIGFRLKETDEWQTSPLSVRRPGGRAAI